MPAVPTICAWLGERWVGEDAPVAHTAGFGVLWAISGEPRGGCGTCWGPPRPGRYPLRTSRRIRWPPPPASQGIAATQHTISIHWVSVDDDVDVAHRRKEGYTFLRSMHKLSSVESEV